MLNIASFDEKMVLYTSRKLACNASNSHVSHLKIVLSSPFNYAQYFSVNIMMSTTCGDMIAGAIKCTSANHMVVAGIDLKKLV